MRTPQQQIEKTALEGRKLNSKAGPKAFKRYQLTVAERLSSASGDVPNLLLSMSVVRI